jgi:hypothetical protein
MSGDASSLRAKLIRASPQCAAIFETWPDAVPRWLDGGETPPSATRPPPTHAVIDLPLVISWFSTGQPKGPAIGDIESTTWGDFAAVLSGYRREGKKDGPNFVAARFALEPDGRHVRRLGKNLITRTAVAIDCEGNKATGELPPSFDEAVARARAIGWAAVVYTSHNHSVVAPRYRIVLPLAEEIDPALPIVEIIADKLALASVFDRSKAGANSLFFLPSANPGELDRHAACVVAGNPIDASWAREAAGKLLAERQAEQDAIATEARAEAEKRRQAKIAAGCDPDASLIEQIRAHLDLERILLGHGYDKRRNKYRHPNSQSGAFGADLKVFAGIERVYSHNGNDPLHRDNLPDWCGGVTAPDAFDVAVILDFGGDRKKALQELAERHGLTRTLERKAVARLIFRLLRQQAPQEEIETAAFKEGDRLGLTPAQVCEVARWVISRVTAGEDH